ncbi:MAG: rhodanese-like domain-containing protein [bacterium]|nr:rhodanese-like domain-containing protein [bacterium]
MKQLVKFIFAIFGIFNLAQAEISTYEGRITPEQTVTQVREHKALLVDVRSSEEFASGHLDGALNISHELVGEKIALFGADKDREIVLYCRSGKRADRARTELMQYGFTKVFNAGGYAELKPTLASTNP